MNRAVLDEIDSILHPAAGFAKGLVGLVIFVALVALATHAWAAPRMRSPEECHMAADIALVARALVQEGVNRELGLAILNRIYHPASARAHELVRTIQATAYGEKREASEFAGEVLSQCLSSGGNLDPVLGVAS